MLRALNDAIHEAVRWQQSHRFEFWAGVYLLIFLGPLALTVFNDVADANTTSIFLMAYASLLH